MPLFHMGRSLNVPVNYSSGWLLSSPCQYHCLILVLIFFLNYCINLVGINISSFFNSSTRPGFLNLDPTNILCQIILIWICPWLFREPVKYCLWLYQTMFFAYLYVVVLLMMQDRITWQGSKSENWKSPRCFAFQFLETSQQRWTAALRGYCSLPVSKAPSEVGRVFLLG